MAFKPYKSNTWIKKYFDDEGFRKDEERKQINTGDIKRTDVENMKIALEPGKSVDVSGELLQTDKPEAMMGKFKDVKGRDPNVSPLSMIGPIGPKEYNKQVNDDFLYNQKHPFYKEAISKYGMPDFTKVIPMNTESKPLDLMINTKTTDGKSTVKTINPLFLKLGIVDVKKKVYQFKINQDSIEYNIETNTNYDKTTTIITTPREYNVIGENKDNYYYMKDGKLVSLAKTDVSESKPTSEQLEVMWKKSINDMINTVRKTTADEERAMEEEIKVYGTEHIEDDIRVLKKNGVVGEDFEIGDLTPADIRRRANLEREKDKPWLERLGEAEGVIGNIQATAGAAKDFIGQSAERVGQIIPSVFSGEGIPEQTQDVGGPVGGVANFLSDMFGYGVGLAGPGGAGNLNIGSDAYKVGEKATSLAGQKIGAKLGAGVRSFFKSPNAQKLMDSPIVRQTGRGIATGVAGSPMVSLYESASQDLGVKETGKKVAQEAAIGGALGGAFGAVGGALTQRAESKILKAREAEQTTLREQTSTKVERLAAEKAKKAEQAKKAAEEAKKAADESKYSKESYKKKYRLGEKVSKEEESKIVENVIKDTGKKVEERTGTKEPRKILDYYKNKYKKELEGVKLQATLKAKGTYGKTSRNAKGELVIKYNPKNDPDVIAGTIRHEIEHVLDNKRGFKAVDRKISKGDMAIYDRYASKTHHERYDFFEPEYNRRQDVKAAINAGEQVPKSILKELGLEDYKPVRPAEPTEINPNVPGTLSEGGPEGISRFRGKTVPESTKTTEAFKNDLKQRAPVKYNIVSNQQDWNNAVDKVFKSPDGTWSDIKLRNNIGKASEKGYTSKDSAEMMALIEYHEKNGEFDKANEVLEYLSEKATGAGQFIQALSIWNRRTPDGMIKYAKFKAKKAVNKKYPVYDRIKNEISDLKKTIESLEAKKKNATEKQIKSIENDIELHSRLLSGKETKLEQIEKKIAKVDLKPEDSLYIKTAMENYKSEAFYQNYYNKKLEALTDGNIRNATEKQKFKASEFASRKRTIELKRALTRVAELEPTTFRERVRAIQRINLLSNARTMLRNNISNAVFGAVEMTRENTVGAFVDYVAAVGRTRSLSKPITNKAASGRTTVLAPVKTLKAYTKGWGKGAKQLGQDLYDSIRVYGERIDTSDTKGPFEAPRGRTFKGDNIVSKGLNTMDNIVKTIVTDIPFYEAAKQARIAQLQKIMKTTEVTDEMLDAASLFALDKVFQNDSAVSKTMTTIRKKIPGLELVMPFSQTPGNVLDKLVDYTPGGLLKVLYQFGNKGKEGFDTKLAVDRISRTLSGAGLAVFAYALAKKGLITGNLYANPSKKAREYEQSKGKKSYAMKVNGKWYTYDWLTPVGGIMSAMSDLVGVQGAESGKKAVEVLVGSPINTVANQSFMSGLFALFGEQSISEGLIKGAGGSVIQAIPMSTLMRQVATFTDEYERDTKAESQFGKIGKRFKSYIPGVRETLEPKVDIFGSKISTRSGNRGYDFLQRFVIPSNVGVEKRTGITNELDRLIKSNKDETPTNVLPSSVSNTIRMKGEEYELTPAQTTKFKKIYGDSVRNNLSTLFSSVEYQRSTSKEKFNLTKKSYSKSLNEAKKKALKSFGYKVDEE